MEIGMGLFNLGAVIGSLVLIWFITWVFMTKPDCMWDYEEEEENNEETGN